MISLSAPWAVGHETLEALLVERAPGDAELGLDVEDPSLERLHRALHSAELLLCFSAFLCQSGIL
jgi:hypothetical protein